jgi:glycosyltransferase involved in cell wall biosynthesis
MPASFPHSVGTNVVCIDARYVRERASGIGLGVEELVKRAPWLAPDLHFMFLKHPLRKEPLSDAPNTSEVVVPWEANGPMTLWGLRWIVDLQEIGLFHSPHNILPAGLTMPSIATIHDLMWIKRPELARKSLLWGRIETAFYRNGMRRALQRAAKIVTVSQATREDIRSLDQAAFQRTQVIKPNVHPDFRHLDDASSKGSVEDLHRRWNIGESEYVLTVGQSSPYKNHEVVVRAFAKAFADAPSMKLVVVQRLGSNERLRSLAQDLRVDDRVVFLPELPRSDLIALYNGALALCHPSRWEGFGLPLAEAMACGCPIVATPIASMPEVAGDAALYAGPGDVDAIARALRRVAFEPYLAGLLRRRGLQRAHKMPSWEQFARSHIALYRELMAA